MIDRETAPLLRDFLDQRRLIRADIFMRARQLQTLPMWARKAHLLNELNALHDIITGRKPDTRGA